MASYPQRFADQVLPIMDSSLARPLWRAGLDRFRPLLSLAVWYVVLGLVVRVVLWAAFARSQQVSAERSPGFSRRVHSRTLVQSLYLVLPFAVVLWLMPDRPYRSKVMRATVLWGAFVWMFALTFVAAAEYFFFAEFDARLNLVAVDYLMYPTEVVGDIWAEYPVVKVLAGVSVLTALVVYALRSRLTAPPQLVTTLKGRSVAFGALAALTLVCGLAFETHSLASSDNRVCQRDRRERLEQLLSRTAHERDRLPHLLCESPHADQPAATSSLTSRRKAASSRGFRKAGSIAALPPIPTGWAS